MMTDVRLTHGHVILLTDGSAKIPTMGIPRKMTGEVTDWNEGAGCDLARGGHGTSIFGVPIKSWVCLGHPGHCVPLLVL